MKSCYVIVLSFFVAVGSLTANLHINPEPALIIQGKQALLDTPEGVSFTPDGRCLAVANADSSVVGLYRRTDNGFETTPCSIIRGLKEMYYPHDLAFTPDGKYLGVASRESHSFTLFRHNPDKPGDIETTPCFVMSGKTSSLGYVSSLDFSSTDNTLVIANRHGSHGLTFYRYLGDGKYESKPYYQISEKDLLKYDLSAPHGVGLSASGGHLGVAHKGFYGVRNPPGESAVSILNLRWDTDGVTFLPSHFVYLKEHCLHSIVFHPSENYFALVKEDECVTIYQRDEQTNSWHPIQDLIVALDNNRPDRNGMGPKGVTFSPDGSYLVVTIVGTKSAVMFFDCVDN